MRARSAATILLSAFALPGLSVGCGPIGGGASGDPSTTPDASSSGAGGSLPAVGPDGGILMAPNGYSVQGNQVLDAKGKPHLFRGMDRPSLEWSSGGDQLAPTDYQNMATLWHGNIVRLSLNQDFWLFDPSNPNYDQGYELLVDEQVRWAEENGMDIILDLHWSDQGDYTKGNTCLVGGKGCQQCMADQHSILFWQQVATRYAHDGHVLFELYNEPHDVSWYTWLNGGTSGGGCSQNGGQDFQVAGMQQLYNTVRQVGAQNLVVIGGLNWAYDLTGVPGNRVQGYNVIYNTHPYASKCGGTCSTSSFEGYFGFLAATDPVIATEYGDSDCSAGFYQTFTQYAQTKGIHWTAWAYYPGGCTFPGLINDWTGSPVMGSGTTVQAALVASVGPWQPMTISADAGAEGGANGSTTSADGGERTDADAPPDGASDAD